MKIFGLLCFLGVILFGLFILLIQKGIILKRDIEFNKW